MLLSFYLFVSQRRIHIVRDSIHFTIDAGPCLQNTQPTADSPSAPGRAKKKFRSSVPILSSSDSGMFQANSQRPKVQYSHRRRLNERDGQGDP